MWHPSNTLEARKGEPDLRFQKKKVTARATALGLALGVVGCARDRTACLGVHHHDRSHPTCGVTGTVVTITGAGFTGMTDVLFNGTSCLRLRYSSSDTR